ncbi:uncharacterized protein LOC128602323 isoform X3 [Ictalurus furcatus]|uniref:uncharacterized protein LOC128602323 isoform X3 n=1 Tax=Ictalurus furcatus TaxID=66913 RepID=UPI002350B938|nr:uncharacterized protein LOC128602323 isoform X3 [Ictalurus furcatus]
MKTLLTFCLIIAGSDAVTTVTGYRGRSVQIKCPYGSGYEKYNKYLCRDDPANSTVSHSTHSAPTHSMSPPVHAEITHSTAGTPLNNANHTISAGSSQEFPTSTVIIAVSVVPVLLLMALLIAVALQRKKKTQALSPAQSLQSSSTSHLVPPPDRRSLSNTLYSTAELPTISPELSQTIYTGLGAVNPVSATVHRQSDATVEDVYSTAQLPTILPDSSVSAAPPSVVKPYESCEGND